MAECTLQKMSVSGREEGSHLLMPIQAKTVGQYLRRLYAWRRKAGLRSLEGEQMDAVVQLLPACYS